MNYNNNKCLMNLILISVIVLLSVQMIKSLNKFSLVENFLNEINDNSIPTTGQKVGKDVLGSKDPIVMFGTPTGLDNNRVLSNSNSDENAPNDGKGNKTKVLFKHSECKPECCSNGRGTFSCSTGCVCVTDAHLDIISRRGGNHSSCV